MTSPTPSPFPVIVMNAAPNLWAWSLDSALALLGAIASFTVAIVAVVVTLRLARRERVDALRRERAEADSRAREARAAVGAQMLAYLAGRMTAPGERDAPLYARLQEVVAASGLDLDVMVRWLVEHTSAVRAWFIRAYESGDVHKPRGVREVVIYLTMESAMRSAVIEWISTGKADLSTIPFPDDA